MDKVPNPYFSVEFSEDQINHLRKSLIKALKDLDLELENLPTPHISISYVLGYVDLSQLESVAQEIVEAPFNMNIVGVDTIESQYYGGTIIGLSLEQSEDFLYSQEIIKESLTQENSVSIREFEGGFRAHISLFLIKDLTDEQKFLISRYLELALSQLDSKTVSGEKLCMYNPDREKMFEKKF